MQPGSRMGSQGLPQCWLSCPVQRCMHQAFQPTLANQALLAQTLGLSVEPVEKGTLKANLHVHLPFESNPFKSGKELHYYTRASLSEVP